MKTAGAASPGAQNSGLNALDVAAPYLAPATVRLPGLPTRNAEKTIGRVADAGQRLSLPEPPARTTPTAPVRTDPVAALVAKGTRLDLNDAETRKLRAALNLLQHPRDSVTAIYGGSYAALPQMRDDQVVYLTNDAPELFLLALSADPDAEPALQEYLRTHELTRDQRYALATQARDGYRKTFAQRYGFSGELWVDRDKIDALKNVMASIRYPRDFSTIDSIGSSGVNGARVERYRGQNTIYLGSESPPELWIKALSARPDDEPAYQAWLAVDQLNPARANGSLDRVSKEDMTRLRAALALVREPIDFAKVTEIFTTSSYALSFMDEKGVVRLVNDAPTAALIPALSRNPDAEPEYQAYLREHPLTSDQLHEMEDHDADRYSALFSRRYGFTGNLSLDGKAVAPFKRVMASLQHPRDFSTIRYMYVGRGDRAEIENVRGEDTVHLGTEVPPEQWITVLSAHPEDEPVYKAWLAADPLNMARANGARIQLSDDDLRRVHAALSLVTNPIDFARVSEIRTTSVYKQSFTDDRGGVQLAKGAPPEALIAALSRDPDSEPAYQAFLRDHPLNEEQRREEQYNRLVRYSKSFSQRYDFKGNLYVSDELDRFKEVMAQIRHPRDFSNIDLIMSSSGDGVRITKRDGKTSIYLGKKSPKELWIKALSAHPEDEPAYRTWLAADPLNAARANGVSIQLEAEDLRRLHEAIALVKHPIDFAKVTQIYSTAYQQSSIDQEGVMRLAEGAPAAALIPALSLDPNAEPAYQEYLREHPPSAPPRRIPRRVDIPDAASSPLPADAWAARRKRALAALDAGYPDRSDPDWAATRDLILRAEPIITLPVIEDGLKQGRSLYHTAHPEGAMPFHPAGNLWDAPCGAPLGTECAATRIVAGGEVPSFRFGYDDERDAPASLSYLHVDDQTIPVFTQLGAPRAGSMTVETLAAALATLPKDVLQNISLIAVEPDRPKSEPTVLGFTSSYDRAISLVAVGAHMNDPAKVAAVVLHEVGHRLAFELLGRDFSSPGWKEWIAAQAADARNVSGYAGENWDEHFAETYSAWRSSRGAPFEAEVRARFKNTFAILDSIIPKSAGAPFKPDDPRHYTYGIRVDSAQFANTGGWHGPGQVSYSVNDGGQSESVATANGKRITYSTKRQNLRVIEGARSLAQDKQGRVSVKVEFNDADAFGGYVLGEVQTDLGVKPEGAPQRIELKTKKGDAVVLEVTAWPSRRSRR